MYGAALTAAHQLSASVLALGAGQSVIGQSKVLLDAFTHLRRRCRYTPAFQTDLLHGRCPHARFYHPPDRK